jgi:hypothetical protein
MRKLRDGWLVASLFTFSAVPLAVPDSVFAQDSQSSTPPGPSAAASNEDVRTLAEVVRQLQSQLQGLNSELGQLRAEEQTTRAEMAELRKQLSTANQQSGSLPANTVVTAASAKPYVETATSSQVSPSQEASNSPDRSSANSDERTSNLEEGLQLANQKITEQSQSKVESGSKYRVRLSGIVLLNLFSNRGTVENQDFPEFASGREADEATDTFGGSLRQSQISLQTFGPDIAGARTSADLRFDFAGGTPSTTNGTAMGIVRLRTGTVRFDWSKTSIIAGQDRMFFMPLSPTSLVSLAAPALSYSGNLWAWSPQVRVEHRVAISDHSNLVIQAGILDSVSGEEAQSDFDRLPSRGEQSGQPAYAARIAWSERIFGQPMTAGLGGYFGRQNWDGRNIDGWIGSADLNLPLGKRFEFSGDFYRGRAVGGFGGAIGQTVFLRNGLDDSPAVLGGLDSMGGWVQLKFKPQAKFEVNAALGDDNPFASELRLSRGNSAASYGSLLTKNLSPFINVIYQPRSDVVFSAEYRHLKTFVLDSSPNSANLLNFAIGYIF